MAKHSRGSRIVRSNDRSDLGAATAMDTTDDLAFTGLRAQAALVASGNASARELVDAALARIDQAQPRAERLPLRARRRRARRGGRGRPPPRAGRAAAAARRPGRDQGRHGPRRRVDELRLPRHLPSAPRRRRGRAQAARRRRRHRRQDEHARGRPVAVHRGPRLRRHAQPVVARPQPRRLVRRLSGRGRGRPGARGRRLRRRRLRADPRRLDSPRRRQAAARPHLDLAVPVRLQRPHLRRPARAHGR